jgi:hypothetical protein
MDVENFDSFSFDCIDHNVGKRRKCKLLVPERWPGLPRLGEIFNNRIRW